MRFVETPLPGAWVIELEEISDERGWFARTFDAEEFRGRGLNPDVVQCNASFNHRAGTLRGMHYQAEPHGESKLVRCVRGTIFDVVVDLRPDSPTYRAWHGVQLSGDNRLAFYIPAGLAHGFQTLTGDSEVLYQMGNPYVPEAARGVRFDDPAFAIEWPAAEGGRIISEKDASYPDLARPGLPDVSRVMLTGATGFVGRHTLTALIEAGHEVHALARRRGLELTGVTWHEVDLLEGYEVVGEAKPEILVHLAWYAEHGKFWSSPENVRWVEASLALLRAFAAAGGRRAVMAGTCAEYEWSREVYPEDAPRCPATLYGAAKHGLHTVAAAYAEQAGLALAWARLFFLYGPHEDPDRFIPSLVLPLLRGEPAPMTDGTQRRDFLHTADAGAALAALAGSQVTGAINIASGEDVALCDVGERLARLAGGPELLDLGALDRREDDPPSIVADVGRLRDELGWQPRIGLDDGLRETFQWWRERTDRPS